MSPQLFSEPNSVADVEEGSTFAPKFGSDGLIACVVRDSKSLDVVMVAHMNEAALKQTLETRVATYWSRSRQKIWVKGETSDHTQIVERIQVDCDQDVLLMTVSTGGTGANCHTGRKSCFYRDIDLERIGSQDCLVINDDQALFDPSDVYKK